MPVPAPPERYACRIYCTLGSQTSINVRHFEITAVVGAPQLSDLADAISTVMAPIYKALITNSATYWGLTLQLAQVAHPPLAAVSIVGRGAGTAGTAPLPEQSCGLISFRTGFVGKSFRGRLYIPFPDGADSNLFAGQVVPTAGYVLRMAPLGNALIGPVIYNTGGITQVAITWGILSRKLNAFNFIGGRTLVVGWANQHSRGDFGRPNAPPF